MSNSRFTPLLEGLRQIASSKTVYNPYQNPQLLANLNVYLSAQRRQTNGQIWVGEALGYRGGSRTGLPFSSEALLATSSHPFLQRLRPRLHWLDERPEHNLVKETTAQCIWDSLTDQKKVPLFWNALPFHPHPPGNREGNRRPTAQELNLGQDYLQLLNELAQPSLWVAVGRCAESSLRKALPNANVAYVRHPSRGGIRQFQAGINALLK